MDFNGNERLKLAYDFVQFTGRNIFLTGKAGTGKTTFLHNLREHSSKRMVVVAPTGVAAINAAGVTIHSFFQLSFGPQVPEYILAQHSENSAVKRFSREKINIIKSMDLLIIDEISMVRADLLDGIDATLRRFRDHNKPFGGVQLLMIGDLQQLAPVVKDDEWGLLAKHYDTPFFFSSKALKKTHYVTIELEFVYRQKDEDFVRLLNKVRDNKIDKEVIDILNKQYKPDFDFDKSGYIILTTHNAKAKAINDARMAKLPGKVHKFKANVKGVFPDYIYPTDFELRLKEQAQVMFIKNDPEPDKKFYNGKIGKIVAIDKDVIRVQCEGDDEPINVVSLQWEKVKYTLNEESKEITESVEGVFEQYPLKPAWAITIHKSQGLTFEKAVIDAEAAFAHGQVYVAFSRCKTLEGMVLSSKVSSSGIKHDSTVEQFTKDFEEKHPDSNELEKSKQDFQHQLLFDLFDFQSVQRRLYYAVKLTNEHAASLPLSLKDIFLSTANNVKSDMGEVGLKFQMQMRNLIQNEPDVEKNKALQDRISKASTYFADKIKVIVLDKLDGVVIETDNKAVRKSLSNALEKILEDSHFKQKCLQACTKGFSLNDYMVAKAMAAIDEGSPKKKRKKREPVSTEVLHPELYQRLKHWRNAKAEELNQDYYMILPLKAMRELSNKLPLTLPALKTINGIGKVKVAMFGGELLDIITDYCDEKDFEPEPIFVPEIKPKKKPTKQISYELWKEGLSVEEIAKERGFVVSTIEGHLIPYVETGDIAIEKLVSDKNIKQIAEYFKENPDSGLSEAKEALGIRVSWSDLHFVQAWLKSELEMGE